MAFRPTTGLAMPPPQTGMRTAMGSSMGTSAGGAAAFGGGIREGKYTEQIYSMIRDGKYGEAAQVRLENAIWDKIARVILSTKLLEFPTSRAAASLYERLMRLCPEVDEYKFYYAQAQAPSPLSQSAPASVALQRPVMRWGSGQSAAQCSLPSNE
eukprot:5146317-Pleurochrysis_carterae.AAC.1